MCYEKCITYLFKKIENKQKMGGLKTSLSNLYLILRRLEYSICRYVGGRHSSVDSSALTIRQSWVRIPSTPSRFFHLQSNYLLYLSFCCKKNENKQQRPGLAHIRPILKNKATHLFVPIGKTKNCTIDHLSFIFRYEISNLWHYDSDRDKITKVLITVLPPALICLFSFFSTTILQKNCRIQQASTLTT